jgi:hypothetical protein
MWSHLKGTLVVYSKRGNMQDELWPLKRIRQCDTYPVPTREGSQYKLPGTGVP